MISGAGPAWYVVCTQVHAEARAASHLLRQGYLTYLPRYLKKRRHARRIEMVPVPLFPRYLFVGVDRMTRRWRSIRSTVGVSHVVCYGNEPANVPLSVIAELRGREDATGYVRLDSGPCFAPGDQVRVLEGVFSTCLGLFEQMTDRGRVAVLLDLLGRKVRVDIDGESVAAA